MEDQNLKEMCPEEFMCRNKKAYTSEHKSVIFH